MNFYRLSSNYKRRSPRVLFLPRVPELDADSFNARLPNCSLMGPVPLRLAIKEAESDVCEGTFEANA